MATLYADFRRLSLWLGVAIALAVVSGLALRSWGSPLATSTPVGTPTSTITTLDVVIHDTYYGEQDTNMTQPPVWEAPAGGDVLLNIENRGKLEHNWAIVKAGVTPAAPYRGGQDDQIIYYGAGMVYRDNRTMVTFVAPKQPGEYLVMCTVENHYPLMQGRLVVK
jgi:hypothetical protein